MRPGQVLSYGFTGLRNSGHATVVIDRAGLADARGSDCWPHTSSQGRVKGPPARFLYGVYRGYPPVRPPSPGVDWAARQSADGARLPPMKASRQDTLLLVIKATGRRGMARDVDVWYSVDGQQYHVRTATSLLTLGRRRC